MLALAPKVAPATSNPEAPTSVSVGLKLNPLKPVANPLKAAANPLKRPNVFKQASASSSSTSTAGKKRDAPMTAAERLISEEQERKRRKMEREAGTVSVA